MSSHLLRFLLYLSYILFCYSGKCKIVEILLSKGAYIDSLTTGGTALHCAAYNGRDAVVKILLDHHADVSVTAFIPSPTCSLI